MADQETPLFFGIDYTIIPSDDISVEEQTKLHTVLEKNGGQFIPLRVDGRVDELRAHTHIISETVDFPDYYAALDACIHVVKPSWVWSSIPKKRLSQTRQYSPDPAMFFSQVTLTCADLPEGDKDAIIAGVLAMGGLYSSPLTKLVTHIVTLTTDNDKCRLAREKMPHCRLVLPHWFDDCFRLGKLIDETPYMFPDPEILRPANTDPIMIRQTPDIEGATSAVAGKVPTYNRHHNQAESPSQSRKQLSVFQGQKILFSGDLNVNEHLARTLRSIVEQAGGEMTASVEDCDTYIGHYRDGMDYIAASQADKQVANLAWFYNVINRNRWTNPLSKLLHYPVPRGGIAGFKQFRISLSNYTGEARIYLENLVKETGAEYTKTMRQDNTHLITAHKQSEKCDAAQEWNINIINHLWLEESYAKCTAQAVGLPRYTHFPPRTNLTEIVGKTPINLDTVRRFYFATKEKTIKDVEAGAEAKNGTTPHPYRGALNPNRTGRKTMPVSDAAGKNKDDNDESEQKEEEDDEDGEEPPVPQTVQKPRSRKVSETATPAPKRTEGDRDSTPPTTGRASKERALTAMHKQKDDIALFQKEMKRRGGVIHGGRRTSENNEAAEATTRKTGVKGRKRGVSESEDAVVDADGDSMMGNGDDAAEGEEKEVATKPRQNKKKKSERGDSVDQLPQVKYKMLVTGDTRWQGNPKKEDADTRKLRSLGVELVQDPLECNILCAPSIKRTQKFVCALAAAPTVVNSGYLDYLLKSPVIMRDPTENWLVDRDFEEKWGLRLDESLERAKVNNRRLFKGWTIFLTDKVAGGFDTWKKIITTNSGTAQLYRGRTGLQFPKPRTRPSEDAEAVNQGPDADEEVDIVYLVSGTEDEEVKLWKTFRAQAEKQGLRTRIVQTEWVLHSAMAQRIEWDDKWEQKEELVPGFKTRYGR